MYTTYPLILANDPTTRTLIFTPEECKENQSRYITADKAEYEIKHGGFIIGNPSFHFPFASTMKTFTIRRTIIKVIRFVNRLGTIRGLIFFPGREGYRTTQEDKQRDNNLHNYLSGIFTGSSS
jgi:hypothetical protein